MTRKMLRVLVAGALLVGTVAGATAPTGIAGTQNSIVLQPGERLEGPFGTTQQTYDFIPGGGWTVVWMKPASEPGLYVDYDLDVRSAKSRRTVTSAYANIITDFVALDLHHTTVTWHHATTRLFSGQGNYVIGHARTGGLLSSTEHVFDDWNHRVSFREVWLQPGECLAVRASNLGHTTGAMMVLDSDPTRLARPRSTAAASVSLSGAATRTVTYIAQRAGWHAVALASDGAFVYGQNAAVRYQRVPCA